MPCHLGPSWLLITFFAVWEEQGYAKNGGLRLSQPLNITPHPKGPLPFTLLPFTHQAQKEGSTASHTL